MPVPLDEYPIHQTPLSMAHVGTSDRNFYDRCIFQAHDRTGDVMLITGLGVYPNLGVIDAYATVAKDGRHIAVQTSGPLGDDRLAQKVGPYRIEVQEPFRQIRLVCDSDEQGVAFDLTWHSDYPAAEEPRHIVYQGGKAILECSRFAQAGSWSGVLRVEGQELTVSPDVWVGTRDRSWGIRPVGEREPAGRPSEGMEAGFWWVWAPLRFDDYWMMVIVQEGVDGHRTLNEAVRVWRDGRVEQLGWPQVEITYRSGSRHPERATLHLRDRAGKDVTIEVETLGFIALNLTSGYGADADWSHGQWMGGEWLRGVSYDLSDPAVAGRIPFGVIDHAARATCDGDEGYGIFEHASIGRHDPTGFADLMSVAP